MSKKIVFTKVENVSDVYAPKPSSDFLPEWYKKTSSYIGDKKEVGYDKRDGSNASIKKCMPVFDALTAGYIIPTYTDLFIGRNEYGDITYKTSVDINIQFHPLIQAPYHPLMNQHPYPKWINPWGIKTPPGYSCLFIPPVHGANKFFTIAEGFVDTDTYPAPVNFPFVLNDVNFQGLIPAGTPMVQVIPIKRDSWKSEFSLDSTEVVNTQQLLTSKFFDRYKTMFWNRKSYK